MEEFTPIGEILSGRCTDKVVRIRGWAHKVRDQKQIVFIILRDSSGFVQVACKSVKDSEKTTVESSLEILGTVVKDERAPGG